MTGSVVNASVNTDAGPSASKPQEADTSKLGSASDAAEEVGSVKTEPVLREVRSASVTHVYLNSVQQMVSGELAGEGLQTGFSRHGLPPQRAPLDTLLPPQRAPKQCPANGVRRIL